MSMTTRATRRIAHLAVIAATQLSPPAFLMGTVMATSACGGPSQVSQGLRFAAGDPAYDAFFDRLYDVQLLLGQAPDREAEARQSLALVVGAPDAAPKPLIEAVDKQTKRMSADGLTLALTVSKEAPESADIVITAGLPEAKDQRIIDAVKKTAETEATLAAELERVEKTIAELNDELPKLEANVEATFRKRIGAKKDVEANLADAKKLMPFMKQRAEEVGALARETLEGLVGAANTTPEAPPPPEEEAPEAEPAPPPAKPARRKRSAPAPKPAPAPPAASDGFEP